MEMMYELMEKQDVRKRIAEFVIKPVTTPSLERTFLQVHVDCNAGNPDFIQPLDRDIRAVFDPARNKAFRYGDARRWILFDSQGQPMGRIAAFSNRKYKAAGDTFPIGGIGFFDCADNQDMADMLFDTAKEWLQKQGMTAMDGPINFGERDRWWGLLVEGFHEPLYGMNFNPPYYEKLFEEYGFRNFYNQICWSLPMMGEQRQLEEKLYEAHDRFSPNPDFKATWIPKHEGKKMAEDFCTVYNKAWAKHHSNKTMTIGQALNLFKSMKPILDEKLVWFAYYRDEPVAMWISIPDINQAIRGLKGRFDLIRKLQFMINKRRGAIDRMVGVIFGVVPEFQGTGIDYFMIVEAEKVLKKERKYKEVELQWQGDFNPKMLNISRHLGAVQKRRLVTYRYLFDPAMEFHRHPILN